MRIRKQPSWRCSQNPSPEAGTQQFYLWDGGQLKDWSWIGLGSAPNRTEHPVRQLEHATRNSQTCVLIIDIGSFRHILTPAVVFQNGASRQEDIGKYAASQIDDLLLMES